MGGAGDVGDERGVGEGPRPASDLGALRGEKSTFQYDNIIITQKFLMH